ncbi:MAG TPA: tRNA uridine-5-carboxymethylaminomethyl(34) synthesis GTPase MnmE [Alphaproteobacteria bacterium]|nr:tRNA uridine-5-carboxymethylaminomethyl(34) synthesis GTPase MnmE [Micavibrio sp.]MBK9562357.1 tRNA uridine-5-carboxymethylaminomethyl(34) synthesis GTPase MnmE [Micavibrio sp.]HQX27294.1 tRNA uridine-5-carboxymethylaminomethyl(34) synthesis GTPase MnmE [Alphaproteobacteria bacterium]
MSETIFALSTPTGRSGIAVIRVSGDGAWASLKALTDKEFEARTARLVILRDPKKKSVIDRSVVLPFKGPESFTGEDVVEYHVHGGRAVIDSLIEALAAQKNHRLAEPGEFTRRAFENGKMDLTEAEAIADLINAETSAQKIQALAQMEGSLSRLYAEWTDSLKKLLAHLEAEIEFPDEDLPGGIVERATPAIEKISSEISAHLNDNRRGERLRDGVQVAIIGAPNAGKSSLVNALARRDIAIVSEVAGTTRDVIEAHLDIAGFPVILADTAGLRPAQLGESGHDKIESEGIRRAMVRAREADIKILLFDGTAKNFDDATLKLADENSIVVVNKSDAGAKKNPSAHMETVLISAQTGEGIPALLAALEGKIKNIFRPSETPSLTRARHRAALEDALVSLTRARTAALPELAAEDVRLAVRAVGRITGRVDVEDLLDVIFRDFCIGK